MKAKEKLKLLGNALTASAFNPYTANDVCWTSVWNACRASLLMDTDVSPELLECILTTPVCVHNDLPSVHHHHDVIWVNPTVLREHHPDQLKVVIEEIYQNKLYNRLSTTSDAEPIFENPSLSYWTKNVWDQAQIQHWKQWVHQSVNGVNVGSWIAPQTSASRFRSCAMSDLARHSSELVHLQVGANLIDVLHLYSQHEELTLEQMLVVKQLCEMCLPAEKSAREETMKQLAMQWKDIYSDGPQVERVVSMVTGTHCRSAQRWTDNLDVHWLRVCQNWAESSHDPCASNKVLDGLLSVYSPQSTSALKEWVELYLNAHVESQTPISDFAATHLTLIGSPMLTVVFPVLTNQQKTVAHEAAASGLFPELQKTLDTMAPKNVVRLPTRPTFIL